MVEIFDVMTRLTGACDASRFVFCLFNGEEKASDSVMSDRVTLMASLHCDTGKAVRGICKSVSTLPDFKIGGFCLFLCETSAPPQLSTGNTEAAAAKEKAKLFIFEFVPFSEPWGHLIIPRARSMMISYSRL